MIIIIIRIVIIIIIIVIIITIIIIIRIIITLIVTKSDIGRVATIIRIEPSVRNIAQMPGPSVQAVIIMIMMIIMMMMMIMIIMIWTLGVNMKFIIGASCGEELRVSSVMLIIGAI